MATISAWAVGSLARTTWLTPVATTFPSFTTSAANGPPFARTFAAASSMACSINRFMGAGIPSPVLPGFPGKATVPYGRLRFDEAGADGVADHAGGFVYAQLLQDAGAVGVGGFVADAEARGGFLGRFALGDQRQHLALALGQGKHRAHRLFVGRENGTLPARKLDRGAQIARERPIVVVARHAGAFHPAVLAVR